MEPLIYTQLTRWYPLLDPLEDHEVEGKKLGEMLAERASGRVETLLELGSGAGNTAFYLKPRFRCTLVDRSDRMLDLSRATNPDCLHRQGDMRSIRLEQTFDAVLLHDAIVYMTTPEDLKAALQTAYDHLRPGGAALFAPDATAESFAEGTEFHEADRGPLGLRSIAWTRDPIPRDGRYTVDFAFLLREGTEVHAAHDQHEEGLFGRGEWMELIRNVGFEVSLAPHPDFEGAPEGYEPHVFLAHRPENP